MGVPGTTAEIPDGAGLVDPDVVMHMDGSTFRGLGAWLAFVTCVRRACLRRGLRIEVDRVRLDADRAHAEARCVASEGAVRDRPVRAVFRIRQGRVVEIWSTPTNYLGPFGSWVGWPGGRLLLFARVWLSSLFRRPPSGRADP